MEIRNSAPVDLVTEETARRIVARALQLDEATGSVRIEHLRAAVLELGVSEAAFEAARNEVTSQKAAGLTNRLPTINPSLAAGIGALAGGLVAAAFVTAPHLYPLRQFAVAALGMASGALALQHRRNGTPLQFHVANFAMWAGYGVVSGVLTQAGGYAFGFLGSVVSATTYLGLTSLVGVVATNLRRSDNAGPSGRGFGRIRHTVAAILRRVTDKLDPHVRLATAKRRASSSRAPATAQLSNVGCSSRADWSV